MINIRDLLSKVVDNKGVKIEAYLKINLESKKVLNQMSYNFSEIIICNWGMDSFK